MRTFKKYSAEYKLAVVREIERCGSVPEVERASGIGRSTLYQWYKDFSAQAKGDNGPGGDGAGGSEVAAEGEKKKVFLRPWKRFTDEFKIATVRAVEGGRNGREVAKTLGLDKATVYRWCRQFSSSPRAPGVESVEELQARLQGAEEKRKRDQRERRREEHEESRRVREMIADPLEWLQRYTQTKDSHWREAGASSPYRPFPEKPYFRPLVEAFQAEPVLFVEKSRDMMMSWLFVGLFTHAAMTIEGIEVLFQSQNEDKAFELVEYAKTLYERQKPEVQRAYPLARSLRQMADGELEFAHGSRIVGIPGGGDQIRSYHPWGLFMDEAAFMPEAGESYDHAVPVCQKIVVISSAGPGWFADFVKS